MNSKLKNQQKAHSNDSSAAPSPSMAVARQGHQRTILVTNRQKASRFFWFTQLKAEMQWNSLPMLSILPDNGDFRLV
jgi:hypothetical protein